MQVFMLCCVPLSANHIDFNVLVTSISGPTSFGGCSSHLAISRLAFFRIHASGMLAYASHSCTRSVVSIFSEYFRSFCLLTSSMTSIITTLSSKLSNLPSLRPSRTALAASSASQNMP